MIEVELKFEFPAEARTLLHAKLDALPHVRCVRQIDNSDVYYDTASFDCLRQAVFIRIRNRKHLEVKFHEHADPTHNHCIERVFPLKADALVIEEMDVLCSRFIPDWRGAAGSVEEAIRVNGLKEFVHIENQRTQYAYENLTVCVDHVEGLGDFLEIETACEERTEIRRALARLQSFVSSLAFPSLQPVWSGYVEMWLRLHHPQAYQLRKYWEKDRTEQYFEESDALV
ncbi:MAG: CYTH domain-containing protein [Chloroflexi bacterium]|nr:CYTH domain-containing protein [Chloroflexota bacterium]